MNRRREKFVSTTQRVLKQISVILCTLLVGLFFATSCEKLKELRESLVIPDPPDPPVPVGSLQYVRTEFGGCNNPDNVESIDADFAPRSGKLQKAAPDITISEDSVNVFLSFLYTCKNAPFETQVEIRDDIMYVYIIDLCSIYPEDYCYLRCVCNYTFDFVFTHNGEINQKYKIVIIDPRVANPYTIAEGTIVHNINP